MSTSRLVETVHRLEDVLVLLPADRAPPLLDGFSRRGCTHGDTAREPIRLPVVFGVRVEVFTPIALKPESAETAFAGTVSDAGTGKPVAGATVLAEDRFGNPVGRTEERRDGRFGLPVRGREREFVVEAEGYAERTLPWPGGSREVSENGLFGAIGVPEN